jgi:hypothetical protein
MVPPGEEVLMKPRRSVVGTVGTIRLPPSRKSPNSGNSAAGA